MMWRSVWLRRLLLQSLLLNSGQIGVGHPHPQIDLRFLEKCLNYGFMMSSLSTIRVNSRSDTSINSYSWPNLLSEECSPADGHGTTGRDRPVVRLASLTTPSACLGHLENAFPKICKGYHAPAMTKELSARLSGALGDPFPWYRGHLLDYILRPRDSALRQELKMGLRHLRNNLDGKRHEGSIASVHIRRTDKLHVEATFHAFEEYMSHVERFFDLKEVEYCLETGSTSTPTWSGRRRVFLASDDASVFQEARSRYPRYEFIGQHRNGSAYEIRTSAIGLFSVMLDLHLLVAADFLVCTASSNICRLAYELLSTKSQIHGDAAFQMQSVDKMYECSFCQQRW
ncbi:Alpha-(1,6)-fucosyltransferase [Sparganum proliferum]